MNAINPWLAVPLVLSQLAGIAGFVLGIINFRHARQLRQDAKEAPARADQRRFRGELRDLIYPVKTECEAVLRMLKRGDQVPNEVPEAIQQAEAALEKLAVVLISPGKIHLTVLDVRIGSVKSDWQSLIFHNRTTLRDEELQSDEWRRRRDAKESSLKEALIQAIEIIDKYLDIVTAIDNGDDILYQQYTDTTPVTRRE